MNEQLPNRRRVIMAALALELCIERVRSRGGCGELVYHA